MSRILDLAHTVTTDATTEFATETGSAEVAITLFAVAAAMFAAGIVLRGRARLSVALRAGGLALAFAVLAVQVHDAGWLTGRDGPVTSWFVAHRTSTLDGVAVAVTNLGSPAATVALAVVVAALLAWRAHSLIPAVVLIGTVGAASAASTVLKVLIGRDRPPAAVQKIVETDHSFPSGHVTGTATLLAMIVVIAAAGRSRRVRAALAVVAALVVVLVAATRVYLGVHWLTDVVGGALLAAFFATLGAAVLHELTERAESRRRAQGVVQEASVAAVASSRAGTPL
ncbi:phosphatase PAP2 family protein [Prescottella agglutinans]|uniref:Membrane-associated phospholipid phosphatase n=1 Tax=Prescottella agglutinans TaxID=1644129 RepID=A0ABT6MLR7_9NOCA|nr:phosphatase PAP2 family protein [Prescottella agglutinans]MDH6284394.1 membrane-associated phospholipid phosphatase [Prescottella agglutinans]